MPLSRVLSPDSSKSTFSKTKPGRFFPNYPNSGGLYSVIPEQLESRLEPFHSLFWDGLREPHTLSQPGKSRVDTRAPVSVTVGPLPGPLHHSMCSMLVLSVSFLSPSHPLNTTAIFFPKYVKCLRKGQFITQCSQEKQNQQDVYVYFFLCIYCYIYTERFNLRN